MTCILKGDIDELDDFLFYENPSNFPLNENTYDVWFKLCITPTNSGDCKLELEDVVVGSGQRVQSHVAFNKACTLLSEQDKTTRGYSGQIFFAEVISSG